MVSFLKYDSSSGKFTGASAGIGTQDSLNTSGIITAAQFSGYSHLIAPYGSTTTITVKVATKTFAHRYYSQGSGNGYVLDNVESPFLTLTPGRTYRFDVSDSSNSSHPFRFYYDGERTTQYTTGVTVGSGYVDFRGNRYNTNSFILSVFFSWKHWKLYSGKLKCS